MTGFTDVFVLDKSDMTTLVNGTQVTLCKLAAGDIVFPSRMFQEVKTAVTGPTGTPTMSVGVTGTATQFTAATSIIATGAVAPTSAPAYVAAATNLIVDFEAGGGNGAAAAAGEIWVWASISRAADRSVLKG